MADNPNNERPSARQVGVWSSKGEQTWHIAEECPVAIVVNRRNYAVMLATPAYLDDFAVGFAISEHIVNAADEILSIRIEQNQIGFDIHLDIRDDRLERLDLQQKRRNMVGATGCGLCGLENADGFLAKLPTVTPLAILPSVLAMGNAIDALPENQELNRQTKSVHAAAWCGSNGNIDLVREDVGRHNAVDKVVGAVARLTNRSEGFLLVSSRCSYEIVEKAARHNVAVICSISAPTGFAVEKAKEAKIALYASSPHGVVQINP